MRSSPRVNATIPATLGLPTGQRIACETTDFSQEGLGIRLPGPIPVEVGDTLNLSLFRGEEERIFPAHIVFKNSQRIGIQFRDLEC